MVETFIQSPICLHNETMVNKDRFVVCQSCGLVLDDVKLVNSSHFNLRMDAEGIIAQNEYLGKYTRGKIGSKSEQNKYQVKRLAKLNNMRTYEKIRFVAQINEATRILSLLGLPRTLYFEIMDKAKRYYDFFACKSACRSERTLIPACLYLTCLERNINIKIREITNNLATSWNNTIKTLIKCLSLIFEKDSQLRERVSRKIDEDILKDCLVLFYKLNPQIYKRSLSIESRKKIIFKYLKNIQENFYFLESIYEKAQEMFLSLFSNFRNRTNKVLALLSFAMVKEELGLCVRTSNICEFLNLRPSVFSAFKKTEYYKMRWGN